MDPPSPTKEHSLHAGGRKHERNIIENKIERQERLHLLCYPQVQSFIDWRYICLWFMSSRLAIATLLYSTDYLPGVFTLAYQVRRLLHHRKNITLCLVVTKELYGIYLSELTKKILQRLFDEIVQVNPLEDEEICIKQNYSNLSLLQRPELASSFIKTRLWELIQFDKVLYLDGDTLPLNADFIEIFDLNPDQGSSQICGSPDIGWPDMFNSGVLLLVPDSELATRLKSFLLDHISIDGADQGILNQFFNPSCFPSSTGNHTASTEDWIRLPFIYNVTMPNSGYESSPAMKYFEKQIRVVHFIGENKPWKGWSQLDTTGYSTRWYDVYKEFQKEYELTQRFQELSVQENPPPISWDTALYDQQAMKISVNSGHEYVSGLEQSFTPNIPERTFPRVTDRILEKSRSIEPEGVSGYKQNHYSTPERVFPKESSKSTVICASDNDRIPPAIIAGQYIEDPERVFPDETSSRTGSMKISEQPERTFPEDSGYSYPKSKASHNQYADVAFELKSENRTGAQLLVQSDSPPKDSVIEKKLASIREEPQEETAPSRVFDWEDSNYLSRVERTFPH